MSDSHAIRDLITHSGEQFKQDLLRVLKAACKDAGLDMDPKTLRVFLAGVSTGFSICKVPEDDLKGIYALFSKKDIGNEQTER